LFSGLLKKGKDTNILVGSSLQGEAALYRFYA